jgi:sugar/nucleoside kinase (ribokinase family)
VLALTCLLLVAVLYAGYRWTGQGSLDPAQLSGVAWVLVSAYALYKPGLTEAIVEAARAAPGGGVRVALLLASFELATQFKSELEALMQEDGVELVMGNEDEARIFAGADSDGAQGVQTDDGVVDVDDGVVELGLRRMAELCGGTAVRDL